MGNKWNASAMAPQDGKTFIVTGANSGIGFEAARELARAGATVVMACRNTSKGQKAADEIVSQCGSQAKVQVQALDLASLESVRGFAKAFGQEHEQLDGLINNAGVMALPLSRTADGFEMQFGTNHLGHFALTGLLMDTLVKTPGSRIVNVASQAHRMGKMNFGDLNWERRRYLKWPAYGQSKLANLLFTAELDRRLKAGGTDTIAVACHPGYASTNLQLAGPRQLGSGIREKFYGLANKVLAQDALMGALPTLYAATAQNVVGNDYIGPDGPGEMSGWPVKVGRTAAARDAAAAVRLWEASEALTHVHSLKG